MVRFDRGVGKVDYFLEVKTIFGQSSNLHEKALYDLSCVHISKDKKRVGMSWQLY